jgi:hypothetical protein
VRIRSASRRQPWVPGSIAKPWRSKKRFTEGLLSFFHMLWDHEPASGIPPLHVALTKFQPGQQHFSFGPEQARGLPEGSRGRSEAKTPGTHAPKLFRTPEGCQRRTTKLCFWHPSGVQFHFADGTGGRAKPRPPATFCQPSRLGSVCMMRFQALTKRPCRTAIHDPSRRRTRVTLRHVLSLEIQAAGGRFISKGAPACGQMMLQARAKTRRAGRRRQGKPR